MFIKKILMFALPLLIATGAYAQEGEVEVASPVRHGMDDNIVAIAPIQFSENGVGLSLSYEKGIDKGGIVSYYLPIIATFNLNNDVSNGNHQDGMFYVSPGLKFYPTTSHGTVKYAIGPSLVIGAGEQTSAETIYAANGTYTDYYHTQSKFVLGILLNNSLNINPTPHFYLGLDFGFGFTYINKVGGHNDGVTGLVQSGFKIGYRF